MEDIEEEDEELEDDDTEVCNKTCPIFSDQQILANNYRIFADCPDSQRDAAYKF